MKNGLKTVYHHGHMINVTQVYKWEEVYIRFWIKIIPFNDPQSLIGQHVQLLTPSESDLLRSSKNATVTTKIMFQFTPGPGSVLSISGFHLDNGTAFNMTLHGNGDAEVKISNSNIHCWNGARPLCGTNGFPDGKLSRVAITDFYFTDPFNKSDIHTLEGNVYNIYGSLFKCNILGE